jgi:uncharacterized membrane protein
LNEPPKGPAQQSIKVSAVSQSFIGPLPPPNYIEGYERALPGSADRIFKLAENEQHHRHALQRQDLASRCKITERGQLFAMILGSVGMIGGLLLAAFNKPFAGLGTFVVSLAVLVGIYIHEQRKATKESNAVAVQPPQDT